MNKKIILAGCGKLGLQLGEKLVQTGYQVTGLKRTPLSSPFPILSLDLSDDSIFTKLPFDSDVIIFTVTPDEYTESGYQNVYDDLLGRVIDFALRHERPPLILLVSSTGVYGQQDGQWVDEKSLTKPTGFSGTWVLKGEHLLAKKYHNYSIVRFSGIYGAGRSRLVKRDYSKIAIQQSPPVWTNRIHQSDCVGVLELLTAKYFLSHNLESIYLASDDNPVSSYDVAAFICQALGSPQPLIKTDDLSMKRNKRCTNKLIKSAGYQFLYPDYRRGYEEIIQSLQNHERKF